MVFSCRSCSPASARTTLTQRWFVKANWVSGCVLYNFLPGQHKGRHIKLITSLISVGLFVYLNLYLFRETWRTCSGSRPDIKPEIHRQFNWADCGTLWTRTSPISRICTNNVLGRFNFLLESHGNLQRFHDVSCLAVDLENLWFPLEQLAPWVCCHWAADWLLCTALQDLFYTSQAHDAYLRISASPTIQYFVVQTMAWLIADRHINQMCSRTTMLSV